MLWVSDYRLREKSRIRRVLTACPKLSGLMSRKAKVFSLSNSLKQGISPSRVSDLYNRDMTRVHTLDDAAKDTGRHVSNCSRGNVLDCSCCPSVQDCRGVVGYGCNCSLSYVNLYARNCQSCRLSAVSRKRDPRSHVTC